MKPTTGLFIFRHDLRLEDNIALHTIAAGCDQMVCMYVIEDHWFKLNRYGSQSIGIHRQKFLGESLSKLDSELQKQGQLLHVIKGNFVETVAEIMAIIQPSMLGLNQHCGFDERRQEKKIEALCKESHIEFVLSPEASLLSVRQLPFSIEEMPDVFSPFRRKIEKSNFIRRPQSAPISFPVKVSHFDYESAIQALLVNADQGSHLSPLGQEMLVGGEDNANKQLDYYLFDTDLIATYKETRNQLDGWDFSSKLSAWLANGSISPATVAEKIHRYEQERVANDSTYWLIFELLWREFFHLQSYKHGSTLFTFTGIQNNKPTTQYDHDIFLKWCDGKTGYPIVDASMRQLNATGFMSNRGRQLVASCLVHELTLDWRYGAAYFEQQLIDYDVASNWGNWQYLAGVGSDPRGHRQFNLIKQTEMYDPNRDFIHRWTAAD